MSLPAVEPVVGAKFGERRRRDLVGGLVHLGRRSRHSAIGGGPSAAIASVGGHGAGAVVSGHCVLRASSRASRCSS